MMTPEEIQAQRRNSQYGYDTPGFQTSFGATPAKIFGAGLDEGSQPVAPSPEAPAPGQYKDMAKGASAAMSGGGGVGSSLTSAGMMGLMAGTGGMAAPIALGAGLLMSSYEGSQQAKAAQERARVEEAQQRKQNVQAALSQALGATKQLGV